MDWQPIDMGPNPDDREWTADLPSGASSGLGWATWDDDETFAFLTWWEDHGNGRSQVTHWRPAIEGPSAETDAPA